MPLLVECGLSLARFAGFLQRRLGDDYAVGTPAVELPIRQVTTEQEQHRHRRSILTPTIHTSIKHVLPLLVRSGGVLVRPKVVRGASPPPSPSSSSSTSSPSSSSSSSSDQVTTERASALTASSSNHTADKNLAVWTPGMTEEDIRVACSHATVNPVSCVMRLRQANREHHDAFNEWHLAQKEVMRQRQQLPTTPVLDDEEEEEEVADEDMTQLEGFLLLAVILLSFMCALVVANNITLRRRVATAQEFQASCTRCIQMTSRLKQARDSVLNRLMRRGGACAPFRAFDNEGFVDGEEQQQQQQMAEGSGAAAGDGGSDQE